jgi:Zn-dependent protease/predicted transcriptional regulator
MSWSWRIGRIAGIPIFVHWTFLILIGWLLLASLRAGLSLPQASSEICFVLALFGCVVLHELGHALMARRFGVRTSDITLLPIGGVARLQRIPEKPSEEFLVAIAGPAVNLVIAAALFLLRSTLPSDLSDEQLLLKGDFASRLLMVNIFLALFNLLPAFPMDGGRILRSLLAMKMDYGRATRMAASVGQFMAIVFGFLGLASGNVMLGFIAVFVWIGAQNEAGMVTERIELRDLSVREAMLTDYSSLAPSETLGRAAELLLAGSQQDFPIVSEGRTLGVLTRSGLIQGLSQHGRAASIGTVTTEPIESVEANSALTTAVRLLREGPLPCLQVVEAGQPVGILTLENISELLMVRSALASQPHVHTEAG